MTGRTQGTPAWNDFMSRVRATAQGGGNLPPAPKPPAPVRPRVQAPVQQAARTPPPAPPASPPSGGNGNGGGGFMKGPIIQMITATFLAVTALLLVILVISSINDYFVGRGLASAAKYKQMSAGDGSPQTSAEQSFDELQLPRNSSVTVSGPVRKVLVNSIHLIKATTGEFKLSMENAETYSWTAGYSSEKPPMPMDEFLAKVRDLHGKGHTRHRFWIEVKSGQVVQLNTH